MHNTKLYNPTYYFGYSFFHFKINAKFITVINSYTTLRCREIKEKKKINKPKKKKHQKTNLSKIYTKVNTK